MRVVKLVILAVLLCLIGAALLKAAILITDGGKKSTYTITAYPDKTCSPEIL